ncbi:MAG: DUF389 domain-containing protein [Sphingobacteriales bacterium]|nr:MAG: DUF389 domain-containing protein [Sphingobacteriales bacterium]
MHRTIELAIEHDKSAIIQQALIRNPYVIGVTIVKDGSLKPRGDYMHIHVLNRGIDDVLRLVSEQASGTSYYVVTSEVASINHKEKQAEIDSDYDEAIWEEMETGLRHNGQLTVNYLLLMAIGGAITAVGFLSEIHTQLIAFIAASVIAPGLEPLAKLPLGLVLRNNAVIWEGLKSSLAGYSALILTGGITFYLMTLYSLDMKHKFLSSEFLHGLQQIRLQDAILSVGAAMASIIMYLSYRRNVIAGPLIALVLIPAATAIGMCMFIGEWTACGHLFKRFGFDTLLIIVIGIILIYLKQLIVHKRKPMR